MASDSQSAVYPALLEGKEGELINRRRGWPNQLTDEEAKKPRPPDVAGLALSGGGIRSATFCLGVLQALAGAQLLRKIDYLSTVSGGGYVGAFFGAWVNREGSDAGRVEAKLPNSDTDEIRFLRENGRYLAPNGAGDLLAALAAQMRNWVSVLIVLGSLLFAGFLLAEVLKQAIDPSGWWNSLKGAPTIELKASRGSLLLPGASETATVGSIGHSLVWSPAWPLVLMVLAGLALPLGAAYWLADRLERLLPVWFLLIGVGLFIEYRGWHGGKDGIYAENRFFIWWVYCAVVALGFAATWDSARMTAGSETVRNRINGWLAWTLGVLAALVGFCVIDTLAQTLWARRAEVGRGFWSMLSLPALAILFHRVWPMITDRSEGARAPGWLAGAMKWIAAGLAVLVFLSILGFSARALSFELGPAGRDWAGPPAFPLSLAFVGATVVAVLIGCSYVFINRSSLHGLYSARLTRAYLGASNKERHGKHRNWNVTSLIEGDLVSFKDYQPHAHGGPLHLINATVNETVSGLSALEQRDRKGFSLCLGPAGINARLHDAGIFPPRINWNLRRRALLEFDSTNGKFGGSPDCFDTLREKNRPKGSVEMPGVGEWIGISGAAVSTGLGARTSLALSLLLGLFNIRLGYWWDSGVRPRKRAGLATEPLGSKVGRLFSWCFPVQCGLFDELLARFHGPARKRWYLSDGGHFENTACYELIRRRIPLIICCDCGCDEKYEFADLANLVRKARIDFGAEIEFLPVGPVDRKLFGSHGGAVGSLQDLQPIKQANGPALAKKHVAVAMVNFPPPGRRRSLLVVLKPTLCEDIPIDLIQYASANPAFPQQTTADQFFDEAQWESYRKLGQHIARSLFGADGAAGAKVWETLLQAVSDP